MQTSKFSLTVYLLVMRTVNKFSLTSFVVKHLSHARHDVKSTFCLPKPCKYFLFTCQVFLGGLLLYTSKSSLSKSWHDWLALEQCMLLGKEKFPIFFSACTNK